MVSQSFFPSSCVFFWWNSWFPCFFSLKTRLQPRKLTNVPLKRDHFQKEVGSSNQEFSGDMLVFQGSIWVFPNIWVPQNGWFIMEHFIKMDDLGVPLFSETRISWFIFAPWKVSIPKGKACLPTIMFHGGRSFVFVGCFPKVYRCGEAQLPGVWTGASAKVRREMGSNAATWDLEILRIWKSNMDIYFFLNDGL